MFSLSPGSVEGSDSDPDRRSTEETFSVSGSQPWFIIDDGVNFVSIVGIRTYQR